MVSDVNNRSTPAQMRADHEVLLVDLFYGSLDETRKDGYSQI
jgi:hypothetical protein